MWSNPLNPEPMKKDPKKLICKILACLFYIQYIHSLKELSRRDFISANQIAANVDEMHRSPGAKQIVTVAL